MSLLSRVMTDAHGWRWAYNVLGLFMLCLGAVILILPWRRIGAGAVVRLSPRPQPMAIKRKYLVRAPFWGMYSWGFSIPVFRFSVS